MMRKEGVRDDDGINPFMSNLEISTASDIKYLSSMKAIVIYCYFHVVPENKVGIFFLLTRISTYCQCKYFNILLNNSMNFSCGIKHMKRQDLQCFLRLTIAIEKI